MGIDPMTHKPLPEQEGSQQQAQGIKKSLVPRDEKKTNLDQEDQQTKKERSSRNDCLSTKIGYGYQS